MAIRRSRRPSAATRERVKDLRQNSTPAEKLLWSALRSRQLGGLKFRRQHPIEPFIVDFYCAEASLVIEVDGETHNDRQAYDTTRSAHLQKLGLTIIRVSNDDVYDNLEGVCEMLLQVAYGKLGRPLPEEPLP